MEAQRDGGVLNAEQQPHPRDKLQVSMSQVQLHYLHTGEKQKQNISARSSFFSPKLLGLLFEVEGLLLGDGVLKTPFFALHLGHRDVTELFFHKLLSLRLHWKCKHKLSAPQMAQTL